jgi:hypothetical protein
VCSIECLPAKKWVHSTEKHSASPYPVAPYAYARAHHGVTASGLTSAGDVSVYMCCAVVCHAIFPYKHIQCSPIRAKKVSGPLLIMVRANSWNSVWSRVPLPLQVCVCDVLVRAWGRGKMGGGTNLLTAC